MKIQKKTHNFAEITTIPPFSHVFFNIFTKKPVALFDLVASPVPLQAVRLGETTSGPRAWIVGDDDGEVGGDPSGGEFPWDFFKFKL